MDWMVIGVVLTAAAFNYQYLSNFKADVDRKLDRMNDKYDLLENQIFFVATGRSLEDAILEKRTKGLPIPESRKEKLK